MASCRAFFALPISVDAEQQLTELVDQLQGVLDYHLSPEAVLRWIKPENYHITLAFLGDIQMRDLDRLHRLVLPIVETYSDRKAGRLLINNVEWFPSALKPCLLAATVAESKPLLELQKSLSKALRSEGFRLEKKSFRPHITLARCKALAAPPDLKTLTGQVEMETEMDELVLFNSELSAAGSRYSPLFVEALGY